MATTEQDITQAILDHVKTGSYPESQEVAASEVSTSAITTLSRAIAEARSTVEQKVRSISQASADDVDGWISQARRLQHDIEQSKQAAREIVQEAEAGRTLAASVKDAGSKVRLLQEEVAYTRTVADTLEQLQIGSGLLDSASNAMSEGDLSLAIDKLGEANKVGQQLGAFDSSRFAGLLQQRAASVHEETAKKAWSLWDALVYVDIDDRSISIATRPKESSSTTLEEVSAILARLELINTAVARLHRDLDSVIISPRFTPAADGAFAAVSVAQDKISVGSRSEDRSAAGAMHDLRSILVYLDERLPKTISQLLLEKLLPSLELQLITDWLDPTIPVRLDQMASFESTLATASDFASFLTCFAVAVPADADLTQWVQKVPQAWLARRKEAMLVSFRSAAHHAGQDRRTAELVETQIVHDHEDSDLLEHHPESVVPTGEQATEDEDGWGAEWNDESEESSKPVSAVANGSVHAEEDEDVSAWGVEEEDDSLKPAVIAGIKTGSNEGEEGDAWGWGGEDDADQRSLPKTPNSPVQVRKSIPKPASATNPPAPKRKSGPREITLRETYSVTALPVTIISELQSILDDSIALSSPDSPLPQLKAAAPALSSLPTLLLAFYRATASTYYTHSQTPNMLSYNDVQQLTSLIASLVRDLDSSHPLAKRLRLDNDLKQLSTFAKRAYGREMDSQRTILGDLLQGISGFANCTSPINAREYKGTIEIAVERVKQVNTEWTGVLADSIRLQSIGSLLGTVITKITSDIIELADADSSGISEEQSTILKQYCDQMSLLSSLFEQHPQPDQSTASQGSASEAVKDLTSVYVPGWLRFQYLAEVLEASLADIKFMWVESGLSLEFDRVEVIDLIEALFADSDYRRNAIREIRATH